MRCARLARYLNAILLLLMAAALAAGCKKAQPSQTEATPDNAAGTAPATAAGNASTPANQPGTRPAAAPAVDTTKAFADMNAALQARDYQKATETLLVLQRKPLTDQQAIAVRGQMVQLQGAVAAGVASGDPNAKAAADQLRASAKQP